MVWRLQLLGRVALSNGGQTIDRFESSRTAALLAYLALNCNRPIPREELAELIWPDESPELARHRLRQSVYSLRGHLEPAGTPKNSTLLANRATLQFNPAALSCDASEFEKLFKSKRYAEARELYIGEFMPGFYDEWVLMKRYELMNCFDFLPENPPEPLKEESRASDPGVPDRRKVVSLPNYLSEFFGRDAESQLIRERLKSDRLITLTGIGGVGKSRLAVESMRLCVDDYEITAFVPLEECRTSSQMVEALVRALQLPPSSAPPMERLSRALSENRILFILDNFEQLVETDSVSFVEEALQQFPSLSLLVTSRRLLGALGETEIPVSPLPLADSGRTLEQAAQNPGVALFISRAQSARPGFQITEKNRADLISLCNALEGLPLALEIAASRIRAFAPAEMLVQLEDRFSFLARPARGASKDQRHRSISATLDFSWRLLSPDQSRFLCALAVFKGGWTATLAKEVCEAPDAAERLESLVMDSLVICDQTAENRTRFRFLEVVREFLIAQTDPHIRSLALKRHQKAFLSLAQASHRKRVSPLLEERYNLLAALEYAIQSADSETALSLCIAFEEAWLLLASPQRSFAYIREALAIPGDSLRLQVETNAFASYLALMTIDRASALQMAEEGIRLAGSDPALKAIALTAFARAGMVHDPEKERTIEGYLKEAMTLSEISGDWKTLGIASRLLGIISNRQGNLERSERLLKDAIRLFEEIGDLQNVIYTMDNLANLAIRHVDYPLALSRYETGRQLAIESGNAFYVAKVHQNFATVYARQERWEEAYRSGLECLKQSDPLGNVYILSFALWNLPEPMFFLGKYEVAAKTMGFIERFWVENYDPLDTEEMEYRNFLRNSIETELGFEKTEKLWREGAGLTMKGAVDLACEEG